MRRSKRRIVKSPLMLILLSPFQKNSEKYRTPQKIKPKKIPRPKKKVSKSLLLKQPIWRKLLFSPAYKRKHIAKKKIEGVQQSLWKQILSSPFRKNPSRKPILIRSNFVAQFLAFRTALKVELKRSAKFRKKIENQSFMTWVLSFRINKFKSLFEQIQSNFNNWYRHSKRALIHKVTRYKLIAIGVNSSLIFLLSYLFTYLLHQLATVVVASHFGLYCKLLYYTIIWPPPSSKLWDFDSVITTFISGPIFSLFFATVLVILFFLVSEKNKQLRLFFLWSYIHSFNFFFSSFIAGAISDQGMGHALKWMYFTTFDKIISSILGIFILAIIGMSSTSNFFKTAPLNYFLYKHHRLLYLVFVVFLPWFLGSLVLILLKLPHNKPYETLCLLPLIFAFIPIFPSFNNKYSNRVKIIHESKKVIVNWNLVVISVIVLLAFRIGLGYGILFDF